MATLPGDDDRVSVVPESGSAYQLSPALHESLSTGLRPSSDLTDELEEDLRWLDRLGYLSFRPPPAPELHTLGLNLAHGCNHSCSYCCVGPRGSYGGGAALMSLETVERAVEFLASRATGRALRLIFFGGEPFLNWKGLVRAVEYSSGRFPGRAWRFEAITNGSLVTRDRARFLARHAVRCTVTLSAPPSVHDSERRSSAGGGTHAEVLQGIRRIQEAGTPYVLKGVVTERMHREFGFSPADSRKYLVSLLTPGGQVRTGFEDGYYWRSRCSDGSLQDLLAREEAGAVTPILDGRRDGWDGAFLEPMETVLLAGQRPVPGCSAGTGGLQVLPDGSIHICHKSPLLGPDARHSSLGSVHSGLIEDRLTDLQGRLTSLPGPCQGCWARSLCPRECPLTIGRAWRPDARSCCHTQDRLRTGTRLAARVSWDLLEEFFTTRSEPGAMIVLRKAFEMRERVRTACRHVRPLFLFPALPQGCSSGEAGSWAAPGSPESSKNPVSPSPDCALRE